MPSLIELLFICTYICLSVDPVTALAIPHSIQHSPLAAFDLRASHITFPELAFFPVVIIAILFSVIGTYAMTMVGTARALAFMEGLPCGATFRHTLRRLAVPDGTVRVTTPHIPPRRGGIANPLSTVPHSRWYERQADPASIV